MSDVGQVDLAIRNASVITASSRSETDIAIRGETIVQLGGAFTARREIDASGKLVMPGGIDMHVHLTPAVSENGEMRWADDFASGTRAAAAGGITMVGNITTPRPRQTVPAMLSEVAATVTEMAYVDFALHPVVLDPAELTADDLAAMVDQGHTSLKIFMVLGNFDGQARGYLDLMRRAAELGMISLIHCEDGCIISHLVERMVAAEKTGAQHYPASRPVYSEEVAVTRAIGFAEAADAPIYVVHLSSQAALEACHRARARGIEVYVETRPLYLYLTDERFAEPDAAKYIGQPPLRKQQDVDALWNGLWAGDIQTFCTDHAPWPLSDKLDPAADLTNLRPGVADLDTLLPMLFSAGVSAGRISPHRFVEVTATNAARLFGLFPRKGTIAVGSDADITIWDPNLTRPVDSARTQTNADYSPYEGWMVSGWPVTTISRGRVVFDHGEIVGRPGWGRLARRGPSQML
ncbi:MAG TPA: dihydropyrimidinase [Thermomicrobiales bacterium]|nr:dihydropyrimidinase [Thermomicrobiales bacterium]